MKDLVTLLKKTGYVYQGSEIYGGLSNTWDLGPLGSRLSENIKQEFISQFVDQEDSYLMDTSILLNPKVWETSGHIGNFNDPLVDCKKCKKRLRADNLIEDQLNINVEGKNNDKINSIMKDIKCPHCDGTDFTDVRNFDLMFKTFQGVTEDAKATIFMRPEIAQGLFINFENVQRTMRARIPFGIAQIGKSFRNEITPGNFLFRTREFYQMEMEYFVNPETAPMHFERLQSKVLDFFKSLGVKEENLRLRKHEQDELAHYADAVSDVEYKFSSMGWSEVAGIANRTDFDLKRHMEATGAKFTYLDPETNNKFVPYVIEPSIGLSRTFLTILSDAFDVEELENGESREVLRLSPKISPVKIAVLPLTNKLKEKALEIYAAIKKEIPHVLFDSSGSIGKRYRRQDEVGTPFTMTVDFDTIEDGSVTIRDRDSMKQERYSLEEAIGLVKSKI